MAILSDMIANPNKAVATSPIVIPKHSLPAPKEGELASPETFLPSQPHLEISAVQPSRIN